MPIHSAEGNTDKMPRIIDAVQAPTDLHVLDNEELAIVSQEIRDEIVNTCSQTGGHLASSLGAVELIVALHAELNCPHDQLVFDVGHQAYAHKILTGRLERFGTLRQKDGISGFLNPTESPYDSHWTGHASDALSIAMGLAKARDLNGGDEQVVAVVGDAAASGGMSFEALNHIGQDQTRMVIVLNDNGMSISPSVGALSHHLSRLRTSSDYRQVREALLERVEGAGHAGQVAGSLMRGARGSIKHLLLAEDEMLFEQIGITCLPPVDGHNLEQLRQTIRIALACPGPVLVHAITHKGHGYRPAELHPEVFHGVDPFDIITGQTKPASYGYSDVIAASLASEVKAGHDVIGITAAMAEGTRLSSFGLVYPQRLIDVGICEEHAVALAAGLATGGKKPVVALYSTFLQRALDQTIVDVALPKLDVVFCVDRAGIVGKDGATHTGAFDLVYMRMIPNLRVLAPSSKEELASALHTALCLGGPFAVRYPRESCTPLDESFAPELWEQGRSRTLREGTDVAMLAFGSMVAPALEAADKLAEAGISARVVDMRWAKPLDEQAICEAAQTKLVVTLEEGCLQGGVGETVLACLARQGFCMPALNLGIPDSFMQMGTREEVLHEIGLDAAGIASSVRTQFELVASTKKAS
ncbi:MAG: 1-deoxy-D-xylulose-5-phosphate synthase [Coriobacteriales bacterium]|nr:1-deoxy-D-xylulose-5-phosphate synthase [Coriobacteriales bacterium]